MKKTTRFLSGLAGLLLVGLIVSVTSSQKNARNDLHLYTQVETLQALEISTKVAEKVGIMPDELLVSPGGNSTRLTNKFELLGEFPFEFFFEKNHQIERARYCHYLDGLEENITNRSILDRKPEESYSLSHYLEAIKYLPQEEILSMCRKNVSSFDVYIATFFDNSGSDRHIYYAESGVQNSDTWSIPLMVQAYYPDGKNRQSGTGADIIWVYYTASSDSKEA